MRLAQVFEELVKGDARFEVCAPRTMNLVCFRMKGRDGEERGVVDQRNRKLMERINATGKAYLTHTTLPVWRVGKRVAGASEVVLRMAIGATGTREEHVQGAWEVIVEEAGREQQNEEQQNEDRKGQRG